MLPSTVHRNVLQVLLLLVVLRAGVATAQEADSAPAESPAPAAPANSPSALAPPPAPPPTVYAPPAASPYAPPAGATYYAPPASGPYYPPPYAYAPRPRARISRGLMIGGIATLGGSYLLSAFVGSLFTDSECSGCMERGRWLFVPVLGPFVAASREPHGGQAVLTLMGAVQVAGAALMIGGIIRFKRTKRRAEEQGLANVQLSRGMRLSLDVHASPYRTGPALTLRF